MRDYEVKSNGIVVDFTKDTGVVIPKKMIYTSGDINTSYIRITCNNNDKPIDLFRYEVNINIVRKDGSYLNAECTVVDAARGEIEVMLTTSMLYVGLNHLEVMLSKEDKQLVSPMIPYKVVTSISSDMDENIPNTNEYPILIQLIGEVKALPEKLDRELTPIVKGKIDLMNKTIQDGNQYLEYANSNETERQSNEEVRKTQELSRQESINSMTSSFNNKVGEVDAKILETTNITNENTKKIDNKIVDIQSQLDTRVATKFTEVDGTVNTKLTQLQNQVDAKILDVDASKDNMISTVNSKIVEVDSAKTDMVSQVGNKIVDADGKIVDCENRMQVIENTFGDLVSGTGYATTQYVDTKVSGIVNSAPEALDTLKELSDALGNDPNFATTIATQIGEKANKTDVYNKQYIDNGLATKEEIRLIDGKVETNKSDILTVKNELEKSVNTKYSTVNGTKEFECKDGYVDNIHIEGETLVNRFTSTLDETLHDKIVTWDMDSSSKYSLGMYTICNMSNKEVYVDVYTKSPDSWSKAIHLNANSKIILSLGDNECIKMIAGEFSNGWISNDLHILKTSIVILEGDHTNKQIPYFEGLKSVGQGDKIEVLSYKIDNIKKIPTLIKGKKNNVKGSDINILLDDVTVCATGAFDKNNINDIIGFTIPRGYRGLYSYSLKGDNKIVYDSGWYVGSIILTLPTNIDKISLCFCTTNRDTLTDLDIINIKNNVSLFEVYDKKQINQTFRSLPNGVKDELVKMGNSYYNLQKCGEDVLNGDEGFTFGAGSSTNAHIILNISDAKRSSDINTICDKFKSKIEGWEDTECVYIAGGSGLNIIINKSKLPTQDLAGFKTWLKDNPITIVYELANPKLIPLPNFNPQTFENKTTFLLNSGVVQGECDFEVTNSLRNEIDVLKDKESYLEENILNSGIFDLKRQGITYMVDHVPGVFDLNDYLLLNGVYGFYGNESGANGYTTLNVPGGHRDSELWVLCVSGTVQMITSYRYTSDTYIRVYRSTEKTWQSWKKLASTTTLSTLEQQVSELEIQALERGL